MGRRGPPPKPTALKLLGGNPGKRAINKAEPKPNRGLPTTPSFLDTIGKEIWAEVSTRLDEMQVLTVADGVALALLCDAYAEWLLARADVKKNGMTYKSKTTNGTIRRPNPTVAIRADAWRRVERMVDRFGLTPAARSGLEVPDQPAKDPIEELLFGNRRSS